MHRVFRQSVRAVLLRDFAAGDRADDAVDVVNRQFGADFFAALDGRLANVQKLRHVQRFFQAVILILRTKTADVRAHFGLMQNRREIEAFRLPMFDGLPRNQFVRAANHVFEFAETEFGHDFAQFLRDEPHEIDGVVRDCP